MSDPEKDFYPAWRFHPTLGMQLVPTRAEDETLKASDAAWVNTQADLTTTREPPDPLRSPYAGYQTAPPATAPPAPESGPEPDPAPKRTHHKKKAA